jgi:hypothetical protein
MTITDPKKIVYQVVKTLYELKEQNPANARVVFNPYCDELANISPRDTQVVIQMLAQAHVMTIYRLSPLTEDGKLVPGEAPGHEIEILPGFNRHAFKIIEGRTSQWPDKYDAKEAIEHCENWIHAGNDGREAHRAVHREKFPMSSVKEADAVFKEANKRLGRGPGKPKTKKS